jgi:hypothetical protein
VRISATTLESFRLFMTPDQEWMTEASLIDTIRGVFQPTQAVRLGQAFGRVLEDPDKYLVPGGYACDDYGFALSTIEPCLALINRRGLFEVKGTKVYGDCTVVAKADHLYGAHLSEFKTTGSSFNFEKYADSCQWRFMVDIFQPSKVTYHIFEMDDHDNGVAELKNIHSFDLYPYPKLHEDCAQLVEEFAAYVTAKGLDGLLRERQQLAEVA